MSAEEDAGTAGSGAGDREGGGAEGDREDLDRPLRNREMPETVTCPFCDGRETEPFSAFGSSLSVSQYYCNDCHTVFEWMKWRQRPEQEET